MLRVHSVIQISQKTSDVDTGIISMMQMRKLRLREANWPVQGLSPSTLLAFLLLLFKVPMRSKRER